MFFKKMIIGVCATGVSVATFAASDEGSGWTFVPSLAYQQKQLKFDQLYTDSSTSVPNENGRKSHFSVNLPTANLSLTASRSKFYITLKYEQSLADGSVDVDETRPPTKPTGPYYLNVPGHETDVRRSDQSITFGFNAWGGLNLFVGYMAGKTTLTPSATCFTYPTPSPCHGQNLALDLEEENRPKYFQRYTEEGPYLGVSYGWQINDAGTLSVSFADARMNGQFKDNYITTKYGDEHFDFTGDSVGTSIGMTWSAPLDESSAYFLDIRRQKYSMSGRDTDPTSIFSTIHVATDETMLGFTAGLQFYY